MCGGSQMTSGAAGTPPWFSNPDFLSDDWAVRSCASSQCIFRTATWKSVAVADPYFVPFSFDLIHLPPVEGALPAIRLHAVPEPGSLLLLLIGVAAFAFGLQRNK